MTASGPVPVTPTPPPLLPAAEGAYDAQPSNIAKMNIDGPPSTLGISEGYDAAVAANRFAYQLRIGDELAANNAKLRAAGYNPPELADEPWHVPIIGSYLTDYRKATAFQAIMANGAQIAGPDERYAGASDRAARERADIIETNRMIDEAKTKRPELGIRTLDEIHQGVLNTLKRLQTLDPSQNWMQRNIGGIVGAMGDIFSPSDPWSPVKVGTLFIGGIGANAVTRAASVGLVGAGLGLLEQSTDTGVTRKLLGLPPLTTSDMVASFVSSFVLGTVAGGLGEVAHGAPGRAAADAQFDFLSTSKRQLKLDEVNKPLWQRLPQEAPSAPPAPPTALPPDIAAMAARPAGPAVFQRLGEGAPPEVTPLTSEGVAPLPGLPPPTPLPATPADLAQRALAQRTEAPAALTSLDQMAGSPLAYVPRDQRAGLLILDRFETKAAKVRGAKNLDHVNNQLQVDGVAPQDLIAPTRPLSETATLMPDIREWQGAGAGRVGEIPPEMKAWISKHVDALVSRDPTPETADIIARQYDPETWTKMDRTLKQLNTEKASLQRVIDMHQKVAAGDKTALDAVLLQHDKERMAARTAGGRSRVAQELKQTLDYYDELKKVRPGGTRPEAPQHLDEARIAARVQALEAKRDEIFPLIGDSYANSQGELGLENSRIEAIERKFRADADNWIHSPWRYPKGYRRPRNAPKSPYEVTLLKGPTLDQLFAERKLDLPQLDTPEAQASIKPGEATIDSATRVNQEKQKTMASETTPAWYKQISDFVQSMEGVTTKMAVSAETGPAKGTIVTDKLGTTRITGFNAISGKVRLIDGSEIDVTKIGGDIFHGKDIIDPSAVSAFQQRGETTWTNVVKQPSLPSGMTLPDLAKMDKAFQLEDGKHVGLAEAWKEVQAELDTFTEFAKCAARP